MARTLRPSGGGRPCRRRLIRDSGSRALISRTSIRLFFFYDFIIPWQSFLIKRELRGFWRNYDGNLSEFQKVLINQHFSVKNLSTRMCRRLCIAWAAACGVPPGGGPEFQREYSLYMFRSACTGWRRRMQSYPSQQERGIGDGKPRTAARLPARTGAEKPAS